MRGQLCTANSGKQPEPDLIERLVGALFGKSALQDPEPMGLKRLNFEDLPDQFVTMTEFAEILPMDPEEVKLFRPLLAKTQLEKRPLSLAFSANEHGWSARSFHERVDSFGAAVVICYTEGGAICGGYNPEGWISLGEDRASNGAFLFTWPDGDTTKPAIKLPKIGGPNLAVIDRPDTGPQFGAEGLTVALQPVGGRQRLAKCRLGTYYERPPGGGRSLFAPGEDYRGTQLSEMRVYVAEGGGVKWELDGIVWKSSAE